MRKSMMTSITLTGALLLAGSASADHNSRWGEGWANMLNDIHNTRNETRGDNTAFRDFVKRGNGADSVNRYAGDARGRRQGTSRADVGQRGASGRSGGNGRRR